MPGRDRQSGGTGPAHTEGKDRKRRGGREREGEGDSRDSSMRNASMRSPIRW